MFIPPAARAATACKRAGVICRLGKVPAAASGGGVGIAPALGPRYMLSIVGRSARPKSVARKSDGRSIDT